MRLLFIMDPMTRVVPDKDTTYAFQRAALARGHTLLHCEPKDLSVRDGEVFGVARRLTIRPSEPWFEFGGSERVALGQLSAIFIRKDPPFDENYLYTTLLLETLRGRVLMVNDPRGLREANEKLYALHFRSHTPRVFVGANRDEILSFVDDVGGEGVIKPLEGAAGAGVMRLSRGDQNARSIVDYLTREGALPVMVQEYLPAVREGDKRVLVLEGKVLGTINRVPRADDLRSNIHVGGRVEPCELTPKERAIVEDMASRLVKDGLFFVGLDFIGERLTEVNVTSPTGIQELSAHQGRDVAQDVIAWAETHTS